MDAVSEVLVDRTREADRLARMILLSMVVHAALITTVAFLPSNWGAQPEPGPVMMISLAGGAPGPDQGRNPMSAKQIQEAVPDPTKVKNDAPPAVTKPDMIEPVKTAPVTKPAAKVEPPKQTPQLHGRTPTQGAEVVKGSARIETGSQAQTQFGGLATSAASPGSGAYTDYADFCCPEYLSQMVSLVRRNWQERQGQEGENVAKFTIRRDGTIAEVEIEKGAGPLLDLASRRALVQTQKLPPLPAAFTPPQLTVHLVFQYKR